MHGLVVEARSWLALDAIVLLSLFLVIELHFLLVCSLGLSICSLTLLILSILSLFHGGVEVIEKALVGSR